MIPKPIMISTRLQILIKFSVIILLLNGCDVDSRRSNREATDAKIIQATHYRNLVNLYDTFAYEWDDLDQGVPPLLLRRFPTDMHLIRPTKTKKRFFFKSLLPLALYGNEEIRLQRKNVENLLDLHDKGKELSFHQREELLDIMRYYKVEGNLLSDQNVRAKLLKRIDTVPPSLILAQAANESGWGMSRFAQHANNIFGEWTFTPGTGLVPKGRPEGETYEVKRFETLIGSIRSYLRNLNTHSAYRSMRTKRQQLRNNGLPVTGYALAGEMKYYSTRRDAYVAEIRSMIKDNHLEKTNYATLLSEAVRPEAQKPKPKNDLVSIREKISRKSQL